MQTQVKTRVVQPRGKFNFAFRTVAFISIGTVAVLNMQPWISFASDIVRAIETVPLLDVLLQLPFIGGLLSFISPFFYQLLGVAVWALVQAAQCGRGLVEMMAIRDPWVVAQLAKWSQPEFKAAAYCAEVGLTLYRYPPYQGGFERLMQDMPQPDMAMIDWKAAAMAIAVIFSVELAIHLFNQKPEHGPRRAKGLR